MTTAADILAKKAEIAAFDLTQAQNKAARATAVAEDAAAVAAVQDTQMQNNQTRTAAGIADANTLQTLRNELDILVKQKASEDAAAAANQS